MDYNWVRCLSGNFLHIFIFTFLLCWLYNQVIVLSWFKVFQTTWVHISLDLYTIVVNFPTYNMDRVKRIWYLSPMRAAKVQASLRIRAVSPEPSLLAHISSESRRTFRQKARSLAPLNDWACAVKVCHDGMLEDTNSLDAAHITYFQPASQHVYESKSIKWIKSVHISVILL